MIKILLAGALCTAAFAGVVVTPNFYATVVGGDNSGSLVGTFSGEIQSVHAPGEFPGPIYITGFNWRAVPGTGPVTVTFTGSVYLSNSPNWPNSIGGHTLLSTTFANNIGTNNTLVLTASALAITDPACAVSGATPCAFGTNFVFTTPFYYVPANGPLLTDIKVTSFVGTGGEWDVADCAPSCTDNGVSGTPLGATTGTLNNSDNVTQFTYTTTPPATPVPPSILLTLAGLACVGFYMGRRGMKLA